MQNCVLWCQDSVLCFVYNRSNDRFPHGALSQTPSRPGSPRWCRPQIPGGDGCCQQMPSREPLLPAASASFLFCRLCPPTTNHCGHSDNICRVSDLSRHKGKCRDEESTVFKEFAVHKTEPEMTTRQSKV